MARARDTEYEFTLPDGSKRFEIIDLESDCSVMKQIEMFKKMHCAKSARPVRNAAP